MNNNQFYDDFPTYDNINKIKDFPPKVDWSDPNTGDKVSIQKKSPTEDYWFVSIKSDSPITYELSNNENKWEVHNVVGAKDKDISVLVEHTAMTASCGDSNFSDRFHASYERTSLKTAKERYAEEEKKERRKLGI